MGGIEGDLDRSDRELRFAGFCKMPLLTFETVEEDAGMFSVRLEHVTDGVVRHELFPINFRWLHELFVDGAAVLILWNVARRLLEPLQEFLFEIFSEGASRQLNSAGGILNDLHGLDSREFVKKPAAARIHQHGMALQFHQLKQSHFFPLIELPRGVADEKLLQIFRGSIQDYVDIIIPGFPWVAHELSSLCFVERD